MAATTTASATAPTKTTAAARQMANLMDFVNGTNKAVEILQDMEKVDQSEKVLCSSVMIEFSTRVPPTTFEKLCNRLRVKQDKLKDLKHLLKRAGIPYGTQYAVKDGLMYNVVKYSTLVEMYQAKLTSMCIDFAKEYASEAKKHSILVKSTKKACAAKDQQILDYVRLYPGAPGTADFVAEIDLAKSGLCEIVENSKIALDELKAVVDEKCQLATAIMQPCATSTCEKKHNMFTKYYTSISSADFDVYTGADALSKLTELLSTSI